MQMGAVFLALATVVGYSVVDVLLVQFALVSLLNDHDLSHSLLQLILLR